ncbi:hypothetical protein B0A49_00988 [Cryomyces minteri]|uniref:Kinesin-like protein n=1 Tax=Cryomyces minteri TaxID=331657 RepID=A0A4U0XQR5_9PEZI|nr:hypothetical protein B0A49_00988 [Cryomyces minteri]
MSEQPTSRGRQSTAVEGAKKSRDSTGNGRGNVVVSVRVRPDAAASDGGQSDGEWMVDGRRSLVAYKGREGGDYYYDNVFTTYDSNAKVYDSAAKRLVRRVMEGYHGTVFAYGMTGTGKTFSMQGTATSPGVIPLAITDIFSFIRENPRREFLLRVSYLEIYNEKIHDLLAQSTPGTPGSGAVQQEEIKLREDSKRGVYAAPLKEEIVQSPTQLLRVIARGDGVRRTGSTQFNARSSRSHAVVQIVVESRERTPGNGATQESKRLAAITPGGVLVSTLSLIDLAGSERAAENKDRRTEGAHINKSLLTLGTVIGKLSGDKDKQGNPTDKDGKHLPYRDSKLTRLLQPALSGSSLISILCTVQLGPAGSIAAASSHTVETLNTLKFASRAKNNIVSHAKKAEEALANGIGDAGSRALLDRYRMEIVDLRKQLDVQMKAKDEEEEKAREIEAEQRHEEQMLEMQLARTALKERIEHLNRLILSSKSLGVNFNRSFSSLSIQRSRASILSTGSLRNPRPAHSSTAHDSLEVPPAMINRTLSTGSIATGYLPTVQVSQIVVADASEDEDSQGENGDGTATSAAQIRALHADLADKNRYISTLEKRLLQARRSSHSRVSRTFSSDAFKGGLAAGDAGMETQLQEKDAEIADLRARLDDKDRMVAALRSAARKRDIADLAIGTTPPEGGQRGGGTGAGRSSTTPSPPQCDTGKTQHNNHNSNARLQPQPRPGGSSTTPTLNFSHKHTSLAPSATTRPKPEKRHKSVDEVTRILDEMIQDKLDNSNGGGRSARSKSGRIRITGEHERERERERKRNSGRRDEALVGSAVGAGQAVQGADAVPSTVV